MPSEIMNKKFYSILYTVDVGEAKHGVFVERKAVKRDWIPEEEYQSYLGRIEFLKAATGFTIQQVSLVTICVGTFASSIAGSEIVEYE